MRVLDPEVLPLTGVAVVEASAGTGKTYTITSLFLRLLLEKELTVDQVLVVTYTRAATAELLDRIRKRLAGALAVARGEASDDVLVARLCARASERIGEAALLERLEQALASLDEAPVLTIHGFCQRVLRDHAFECGGSFETELTPHSAPLLEEIADDYFLRELYDASPLRARLLLDEPGLLRDLAAKVASGEVRVLPAEAAEQSFDLDGWRAARDACRALFERDREGIVAILAQLKNIKSHAYRWADTAEALLRSGDPGGFAAAKSFAAFTVSGIRAKTGSEPPDHAFFRAAERLLALDAPFEEARQSIALAFRRRFVDYVGRELGRRTEQQRVRTFDALLTDLDRALAGPRGPLLVAQLRKRYRAALVDEFQDTDPTQYRIFRSLIAGSTPLLLIGDPKQAIYGFRGADVAAYLAARAEAGDQVYTLDVNWRSDPPLIAALNALYERVERPFAIAEIAYQRVRPAPSARALLSGPPGSAPLELALARSDASNGEQLRRELAREVASDIAALLASSAVRNDGVRTRRLAASDIAVLCRTNAEAALVQLALSERGVPAVLSGDASVFDSDDVPQLERALTAMAHPAESRAVRAFLSSIYGGKSADEIRDLERDDAEWEAHRARFQHLHETWLSRGFMQAMRELLTVYEVEQRLLSRPDGLRRVTNLWHLAELLTEASLGQRLGPLGLLRWLAAVRRDEPLRSELAGDAHELRLESSDDAVTLTTVHKSKGLEYPIVYCPFMWEATRLRSGEKQLVRFHDPAHGDALTIDLGTPDKKEHERIAEGEALAEALRLLYVALTRGKHRVTVVVPRSEKLALSALGYCLFGGGDRTALAARIEAARAAGALEGELRALAAAAPSVAVRSLELRSSAPYRSGPVAPLELGARPVRRRLDRSYRVTSFSALVARERTAFGEAGLDRDALSDDEVPDAREMLARASELALGDFPRGAVAGQLIHEVLEHADFGAEEDALAVLAARAVRTRGYPAALVPGLARGLAGALRTPLCESGLSLSMLPRAARINEMEFVLPVDALLSPARLERTFRAHAAPAALPAYASELRELTFDALHGFMRGYVDLVFRHEGRFYVVDYKSNWLGPSAEDYAPGELARPMADHHYYLQYHLYAVALHRYLAARQPGYDYDAHFGGVYYLFLRGMHPSHPLGTGVFHDRPPRALIEALDRGLRGGEEAGR